MLKGRILITGGAGFLGRAILRRIEREGWPAEVTIYSRDEHKQDEIRKRWPGVRRILGDVQNFDRLHGVLSEHRYDLVIHTAALKFIPEGELNVNECVDVNIIGSRAVALAAIASEVPTVVGLSTDKAAAPLNTYGMTKAIMERVFAELNRQSATRLVCVRYGNVCSSSGSVVPLFREQYARTGKVSITSPEMTRFWLTNDDAIDMITTAADNAQRYPGGVFVPRCGAMHIGAVAVAAVPELDATGIEVVGLRPGEKLHEVLLLAAETPRATPVFPKRSQYAVSVIAPPNLPEHFGAIQGEASEYRSDNPASWISVEQFREWIADAEEVLHG